MTTRDLRSIRVDAVIPVYNEQHVLEGSVARLHAYLTEHLPYDWRIVIADNASTDQTLQVARDIAAKMERVEVLHLDKKGRGRALRAAWLGSRADILSYMDVDLSTDLAAYPPLIGVIAESRADLSTGRRLGRDARVEQRKLKREITSRGYNLIIKAGFRTRFTDAQCGFKAISRPAADALLPLIRNNEWFFDTELLIVAEKKGYRIAQVPVHWIDDPDTRVKIVNTAMEDLRGLWRLKRAGY
ncbi:MAG: glycosyltransferase family 2 protein [Chloroflexi bacterium]|nr:glycosyltransferase family 2 protein [Chloroflexota bacterium]